MRDSGAVGCCGWHVCLRLADQTSASEHHHGIDLLAPVAAFQDWQTTLRSSDTANVHLEPYYISAYEVIGNPGYRVLYDAASQLGMPDCAKLFTDTESRLPVTAHFSPDIYRQLTLIW